MNCFRSNSDIEANKNLFAIVVEDENWCLKLVSQTSISSQEHQLLPSRGNVRTSKPVGKKVFKV